MIRLRYGNTSTFFIPGAGKGLLVDTDYAGTLPGFFRAIKKAGIGVPDIGHLLITHWHPDHCGLAGELQRLGIRLILPDVQTDSLRFPDVIFERDGIRGYIPADISKADVISCSGSREYLAGIGIEGEIVHTPSHSADSVSLMTDGGCCFAGDLEPMGYISGYDGNAALEADWETVMRFKPKTIFFAHANEKTLTL